MTSTDRMFQSLLGEYKFLDLSGVLPILGLKKNVTASLGKITSKYVCMFLY